ncbi:mechanosensitive ion channel family protein [Pedobacter sp. AW31-3R]|uniref:mechanosensitive ion channel family protein n=1 Tax=Pedobacter sp. AW31-3R TaxID=3445781 RepID=UPI003FA073D7
MNKIEIYSDRILDIIVSHLPSVVMAIILLIVGSWLIKKLIRFLHNRFHRNNIDISLSEFLISIVNVVLYVLLIISCTSMVGIETGSFMTILGAAGLAIGLALQGSLSNFAGGVLILLFKPFRVGHFITSSNNVSGTVLKIDILYTTLKAGNGTTIYAPNGPLANAVINNTSDNEIRQAEYKLNLSFDTNIDEVRKIILQVLVSDELVLQEPKPVVLVGSLTDTAIVLQVRAWALNANFWPVYHSNYEKIIDTLAANDIRLPATKPEIHLINSSST